MDEGCADRAYVASGLQEIISIFASVERRIPISKLCMLAFAFVLLHSLIPHSHHCTRAENHIHVHYSCSQLESFLQSSDEDAQLCIPADALVHDDIPDLSDRPDHAVRRISDLSCRFISKTAASLPHSALRGPPFPACI